MIVLSLITDWIRCEKAVKEELKVLRCRFHSGFNNRIGSLTNILLCWGESNQGGQTLSAFLDIVEAFNNVTTSFIQNSLRDVHAKFSFLVNRLDWMDFQGVSYVLHCGC